MNGIDTYLVGLAGNLANHARYCLIYLKLTFTKSFTLTYFIHKIQLKSHYHSKQGLSLLCFCYLRKIKIHHYIIHNFCCCQTELCFLSHFWKFVMLCFCLWHEDLELSQHYLELTNSCWPFQAQYMLFSALNLPWPQIPLNLVPPLHTQLASSLKVYSLM